MNLNTGEELPLSASAQASVNSVTIEFPYIVTLDENDNEAEIATGWNVTAQNIVPGVTWTPDTSIVDGRTKGTMTTVNTVFGIQMTPTANSSLANATPVKFAVSCADPARLNIGIYYNDGSSNWFPAPERATDSYEYNLTTDAQIEAVVITNAEEVEWKLVHGIRLSNTDCDQTVVSDTESIPSIGDNIAQLGYRWQGANDTNEKSRGNAIIIAAYNTPDNGTGIQDDIAQYPIKPPSYAQYEGIASESGYRFELAHYRKTYMDANGSKFIGDFYTGSTIQNLVDLIDAGGADLYNLYVAYSTTDDPAQAPVNPDGTTWSKTSQGMSWQYMGFSSQPITIQTGETQQDAIDRVGNSLVFSSYDWAAISSGAQGPTGPQGPTGAQGQNGVTPTIYKLIDQGSRAYVSISINNNNDIIKNIAVSVRYKVAKIIGNSYHILTNSEIGNLRAYIKLAKTIYNNNPSYAYYKCTVDNDVLKYTWTKNDANDVIINANQVVNVLLIDYNAPAESISTSSSYLDDSLDSKDIQTVLDEQTNVQILSGHQGSIRTLTTGYDELAGPQGVQGLRIGYSTLYQDYQGIQGQVTSLTSGVQGLQSQVAQVDVKADGIQSTVTQTNYDTAASGDGNNLFGFNRGCLPENTTTKLSPYLYGMIGWGYYVTVIKLGLTETGRYVAAFDVCSSSPLTITPSMGASSTIYDKDGNNINASTITTTSSFVRYYAVFDNVTQYINDGTNNGKFYFSVANYSASNPLYVRNIQIIKDDNAIRPEFTHAAEDIEYAGSLQEFSWDYSYTAANGEYRGLEVVSNSDNPSESGIQNMHLIYKSSLTIKNLTPYTLSFWAKASESGTVIGTNLYRTSINYTTYSNRLHSGTGNIYDGESIDGNYYVTVGTQWQHYVLHWMPHFGSYNTALNESAETVHAYVDDGRAVAFRMNYTNPNNTTATVDICGVLLQEGWVEQFNTTSSSFIKQSANSITLGVQDIYDKLEYTGINIETGEITLHADDTTIVGNLNITDAQNGLTVYKTETYSGTTYKVPRINVQPKTLDSASTVTSGEYMDWARNYANLYPTSSDSSYKYIRFNLTFLSSSTTSIYINQYDELNFGSITCMAYKDTSTSIGAPYFKLEAYDSTNNATYDISNGYQHMSYNYSLNYKYDNGFTWTALTTGTYQIYITLRFSSSNIGSSAWKGQFSLLFNKGAYVQTYIGTNGFYSRNGAYNTLYAGKEEIRLQNGLGGLRIKGINNYSTNIIMPPRVEVGTLMSGSYPNPKPLWLPIWNYTPVTEVTSSDFIQKTIYYDNDSYTKYVYDVETSVNGIIWVSSRAMNNNDYQETWIRLPYIAGTMTDSDGNSGQVPSGFSITIINDTDSRIYVVPYRTSSSNTYTDTIRDANGNYNQYFEMNGGTNRVTKFIKLSAYSPYTTLWFADKDT